MTTQRRFLTLCGIVLLFGLAQVTSASAQYSRQGGWDRYGDGQQIAYDNGFREGLQHGNDDAQRNRKFNFREDREYQRADDGYDRRYGDREMYRRSYRDGYEAGYAQGFDRRGGYGNGGYGNGGYGRAIPRDSQYPSRYPDRDGRYSYPGRDSRNGYNNPAFDVGFSEGYEKGLDDGRDRDRYDPLRHKWYREGDHGYNGRYGSKEQYKIGYRDGFKEGYDRGYREATTYDRNNNRGRYGQRSRFPWPW